MDVAALSPLVKGVGGVWVALAAVPLETVLRRGPVTAMRERHGACGKLSCPKSPQPAAHRQVCASRPVVRVIHGRQHGW